jgi:membrane-bound ClpP family serine protease
MTEQVIPAAIVAAILILVVVGIVRVILRRRESGTAFGAGGSHTVPLGTNGVAKTALEPSGVVYAAGEEWTARSARRDTIAEGTRVNVVGQDGLTLIVETEPAGSPAEPAEPAGSPTEPGGSPAEG